MKPEIIPNDSLEEARRAIFLAVPGSVIIYNHGRDPGPLGPVFLELQAQGLFDLVQKRDRSVPYGKQTAGAFWYHAIRTKRPIPGKATVFHAFAQFDRPPL